MQVKSECWQSDELYNSAVVVVVQRNAGSRIVRALASVYRQDYEDIGVLFIDDASTDDTRSLASDFFAQNMVRGIKVAIHFNVSPTPKIASLDTAIRRVCKNPESVIFWLDG
ncbi:MAG: glycosyltransferase family 2 protein, partial [Ardenticatenaceae bacterium]|nr:glycosyltransferase family 2 protein [Ardenticatenaceae bacterium]